MSPRLRRVLSVIAPLVLLLVVTLVSRSGAGDDGDGDGRIVASAPDSSDVVIDLGTDETDPASTADDSDPPDTTDAADPQTETTESDAIADGRECVGGDVDTIEVSDLPDEAIETLDLIGSDGPYPYDQDDAVFQNRERILPQHERGYYHEYTVETPGSDDRGARRIVTGECGERWYTDDHYDSFALILGQP